MNFGIGDAPCSQLDFRFGLSTQNMDKKQIKNRSLNFKQFLSFIVGFLKGVRTV